MARASPHSLQSGPLREAQQQFCQHKGQTKTDWAQFGEALTPYKGQPGEVWGVLHGCERKCHQALALLQACGNTCTTV